MAVIDSCVARGTSDPAAIEYLLGFGSATVERVRFVMATHWHDDHIRGLSRILAAAPDARFGCSMALKQGEFLTLVGLADDPVSGSGVDEIAAVLKELSERRDAGRPAQFVTPQYAIEHRELLHLDDSARSFPVSIRALSPSDSTIQAALHEIAALIPHPGEPQLSIPYRSPNHASVVLWIEAADRRVLLGADLENTGVAGAGWMAVLDAHHDPLPAGVFKLPHHGSPNADTPDVWARMVSADAIALIAPYNGGKWLPGKDDCSRILARTPFAYCTARQPAAAPRRDPVVEKQLRQVVKRRLITAGQPGHVRVRWRVADPSAHATVELFNGTYQLSHP